MNQMPESVQEEADDQRIVHAQRMFEPQLVRYACSLVRRADLAQEIVQDTFLQLCQQNPADQFAAEGFNLRAWLFRVCRNRAIDVQRKEKRMQTEAMTMLDAVVSEMADPATIAADNETATRIEQMLTGLSENQQEVVRLKFQNGFSYREIAEVTGLTVSNVGVQLHTALQKIRERMKE
jgi:RNA polymerase sigma-70 factor (ECF subfamily)